MAVDQQIRTGKVSVKQAKIERILIATKGDYITRLILDPLLAEYPAEKFHIIIVSADSKGRSGLALLKAMIRDYAFSYFIFELMQFLIFKAAEWLNSSTMISVKRLAKQQGITITETKNINAPEIISWVKGWQPDMLVSAKCPQKINQELINLCPMGALNVHGSLLPKYAGRAPHFWAMANGETDIGYTIHAMTERFDQGHIFAQQELPIKAASTVFSMMIQVAKSSGHALSSAITQLAEGQTGKPQEETQRSYVSSPTKGAVKRLKKNGFKLFRFKQLFAVLRASLIKKSV